MFWSAARRIADAFTRRPIWAERDGAIVVFVRGYSVIDNLLAVMAGIAVLTATVAVLVSLP